MQYEFTKSNVIILVILTICVSMYAISMQTSEHKKQEKIQSQKHNSVNIPSDAISALAEMALSESAFKYVSAHVAISKLR